MNYLDIIFIVIAFFLILNGFRKGIIKSIGGILGIFVAVYLTGLLYPSLAEWMKTSFDFFKGFEADVISFIVLFLITNRLFALVIYIVDKIFSLPVVGGLNKLLGALFGFLQALLIVSILVTILANFGFVLGSKNPVVNSRIAPYVENVLNIVKPFLPDNLKDIPSAIFNKTDEVIGDKIKENLEDMSLDELIDYLNQDNKVPSDIIKKIKENEFKNQKNITAETIKEKFEEYLNNIKE